MPRRLTIQQLKNQIEKWGFFLADGQTYNNNLQKLKVFDAQENKWRKLTLKQMQYRVKKDKRGEFDFMNILPPERNPPQGNPQAGLTSTQRWINRMNNNPYFNNLSEEEKRKMFVEFNNIMRNFNTGRHFRINFRNTNITEKQRLFILVESLKEYIKNKPNKIIRIETLDTLGFKNNHTLTIDTLNYFVDLLNDKPQQEMTDSINDIFDDYTNWASVDIYFEDRRKPAGGFFTYLNKTSLDLSVYGIFSKIDNKNYENNCLIQSFINSNLFSQDEINLINNCINTRLIKVEDLKDLSEMLKVQIVIRVGNDNDNQTKAITFKPSEFSRKITIVLYMNHFMLYKPIYVSEYYLKNYKEIDNKYQGDSERFSIIDQEGTKDVKPMSLIRLIKLAIKYQAFEYIPLEKQIELMKLYKHITIYKFNDIIEAYFKPIVIKDKNEGQMKFLNKMNNNDGYKLFASHIPKEKLPEYYNKLQKVINSLGIKINVKNYISYSELMEKIMYEFGCFENVFKICGPIADSIRNELTFPVPHTPDNKPLYCNKKLYYIDLNGAYLSCINNIPTGKPDKNYEFEGKNTKIKELLEKLYDIRIKLKKGVFEDFKEDPILANTIKYMSNSSWGLSIKRSKRFKKTKPQNKEQFINQNPDFVVEFNKDFVKYIKSLNVHYSYPQFAKEVLQNFENKMNEVVGKVKKVYYYNVDAILIDEEDFNKLKVLGYIGEGLGYFKVEHIFKEIAIKSKRRFMGILENGEVFNHQTKNIDFQKFKEGVLSSPDTTVEIQE